MSRFYKVSFVLLGVLFVMLFAMQQFGELWCEGWMLWAGATGLVVGSALTAYNKNN
jgi:hypothetical protein